MTRTVLTADPQLTGTELTWTPRTQPAPRVVAGPTLLLDLLESPHRTLEALRTQHGDVFVLRLPLLQSVTVLAGPNTADTVRMLTREVEGGGLPGERAAPLDKWAPVSSRRPLHLDALRAIGRRQLASRLREQGHDTLDAVVRPLVASRLAHGPGTVDLGALMVELTQEAAARLVLGSAWSAALGPTALPALGTWARGADVARALLAGAPLGPLLPERRAASVIGQRLLRLARDPGATDHEAVHDARTVTVGGKATTPEDVTWLMSHALWCSTVVPSAYAAWCLVDVLADPDTHTRARRPYVGRTALLEGAVLETMRLAPPVSPLLDQLAPARVRHGERLFDVPAGRVLVLPCTDADQDVRSFPDPLSWRPERYVRGAPTPHLLGTGPFARVMGHWSKRLLASVMTAVFDTVDVRLLGTAPDRRARMHLLPPDAPLRAAVTRR